MTDSDALKLDGPITVRPLLIEGTEMTEKKKAVLAEPHATSDDPFTAMVERLASNPDVDADKLDKLVSIQMRILDRQAEAAFNAAMARVQAKLPIVLQDAQNKQTGSRYARHEAISIAIKPIYTAEGFSTSFSQADSPREDHIRVNGTLRHTEGHSALYFVDLPIDDRGIKGQVNKTPLHAAGSTFSYGRRYLTCMMFDVATGDDNDGNVCEADAEVLSQQQLVELQDEALRLYASKWRQTLEAMTQRYFNLGHRDFTKIPAWRFSDAMRQLKERAPKRGDGNEQSENGE